MATVVQIFIFAFGAVIGSFLNAVVWRLRTKESFVRGRSYCPECRHQLAAIDLIPILSYLLLTGRCRYCRKGISAHYPVVEAVSGLLFLLAWFRLAAPDGSVSGLVLAQMVFYWYLIAVFILVFMYDLKYLMILPEVVGPAAAAALAANIALGHGWLGPILGAVIAGGFFRLQFVLSRGRWVGGGDAWLGLLIGAALGWQKALLTLLLAYVGGALVALVMLGLGRKKLGQQLAFGTFLSVAALFSLIFGDAAIHWYLGLI